MWWNSSPQTPSSLLSATLFSQFWVGNGSWRSWWWLRQNNTSEWKGALGGQALLRSFILSSERRCSSVRWVPSFPVFAEDMTQSMAQMSVTVSVRACRGAWCCISMTSHKSRQEEASETASHERSELTGGEMLIGVYIVKPASFSLSRYRNVWPLNRFMHRNDTKSVLTCYRSFLF